MKITAGFCCWCGSGCSPIRRLVSAQAEATDKAGQRAQTQEEQTVPTPTAPELTGAVPTAPEQTGAVPTAPTPTGGLYGLYPTARQAAG